MCSCIIKNCQYDKFFNSKEFIQDKKLYYVKDSDSLDQYCLFHTHEAVKEKFTYYQNELFKKTILDYIDFCIVNKQTIDFSQSVFHVPFEVNDLKEVETIDFTETIFVEYFRMDNLECKKIIFKDTEFHDGGGIKNKGGEKKVNIENLIFRPYQLESDFVIDIGKYANNKGLIESDTYGVVKNIRFENHKKGKGIVYFIGLNEHIEEANFRNMNLDNVSFQNCDLSKCYFLNAKVDKTEFRNCAFPKKKDFLKNQIFGLLMSLLSGTILVFYSLESSSLQVLLLLLFIFSILYFLVPFFNSHIFIFDEITIRHKDKKIRYDTWKSLSEAYRMLNENLSKNDYQRGGDFFYSQRLAQLYYNKEILDNFLYNIHYLANGFGEKYIRPLFIFSFLILFFSLFYIGNKSFVATEQTPQFFLAKDTNININLPYYKNQIFQVVKDGNSSITERRYIPSQLDNDWSTNFVYSSSQFISPFIAKNKAFFKTVSSKSAILNIIETILLYFFFGAFLLAVKNRIKR